MSLNNYEKLKAAIHYICEKASGKDSLDHIKLNKILWYSDVQAYMALGVSITGERYIKKPFGPVTQKNKVAVTDLQNDGAIKSGKSPNDSGYWQTRLDVLQEADTNLFTGEELKILDEMIKYVLGKPSTGPRGISEQTHGEIWELAEDGEQVPLYTVFAETIGTNTPLHIREATADLR